MSAIDPKMSAIQDYLNKKYSKKTKKKKTTEPAVKIIDSSDDNFGTDEKPEVVRRRSPSLSPVRRGRSRSPSTSPDARKRRREPSFSPDRKEGSPGPRNLKGPNDLKDLMEENVPRMSDGSKAGLQTAKDMKRDLEIEKERRQKQIEGMDDAVSGRNAKTVYRDKTGRKVDLEVHKAELAEKKRLKDAEIEAELKWGKGVKQNRDEEAMAERIMGETNAPLAVYADDVSRNEELKSKDRWGDPMSRLLPKREGKETRPMYKGNQAPPNRFGILPVFKKFIVKFRDIDGMELIEQMDLKKNISRQRILQRQRFVMLTDGAQRYFSFIFIY